MKPKPIIETGTESSFWYRSMRMLFDNGMPLPPMTILACELPSSSKRLLGCITQTQEQRLIFWPPLPRDVPMLKADGKGAATDHVTLELANKKSHATWFNAKGERDHRRDGWVLDVRQDCALSLWFNLFVPFSVLMEQDHAMNVDVPMPSTDADRRVEKFKQYGSQCRVETIKLQHDQSSGDYLFSQFFLQTGETLSNEGLQIDLRQNGLGDLVTEFDAASPVSFMPLPLRVGVSTIVIYSAAPPGKAKEGVMLGFPHRRSA